MKLKKINYFDKSLQTTYPVFFYLSLFFMPFLGIGDYRPVARPSELFFVLFVLFNLSYLTKLMKTFSAFWLMIPFNIFYLIIGLLYVNEDLYQAYLPYALGKFFLLLISILFFIFTYRFFSTYKVIKIWMMALIFFSLAHISLFFLGESFVMRRAGFFYEGNFASLYYILSFLIIYYSNFKVRIKIFTLSLIVIGLIISKSTIGFLCFILICLMIVRKKYFFIFLLALFPIFLIDDYIFLNKLGFVNNDFHHLYSINDRLSLIQVGFDNIKLSPFFGHGLATYPFIIDYSDLFADDRVFAISNNVYIDLFINYGVIGAFIFFLALYKLLRVEFFLTKKNIFVFSIIFFHFLAYPSLFIPFIWVGIALLLKLIHINHYKYA